MVLGKFLPPHNGHKYLVDFARSFVDELSVVVGTLAREPIPGELRHRWVREMFPDANVVHLRDENPQYPEEHPDFWEIWRRSLERVLPGRPDYVFASEDYGKKLAEILGAVFIPVDRARSIVPISATKVREDPFASWSFLPDCVRAHFARRICVFGPESTGKTTLARRLAERYDTVWVPEYARELLESKGGDLAYDDLEHIARGQVAAEEVLARRANKILFCDTDVLATAIWSHALYGRCDEWIEREANARGYDLYLLTDVDVPWVADVVRYLPNERESFRDRCIQALESRGRAFVRLSGTFDARFSEACRAVDAIVAQGARTSQPPPGAATPPA